LSGSSILLTSSMKLTPIITRIHDRIPAKRMLQLNKGAWFMLALLTAMNLVNYLDRYVVSAVLPLIKNELQVSDSSLGTLATAFIFAYLLFSLVAGYIGDRSARKYLVSGGVFVWSLATIASGLARNYHELLIARAVTGIGEAGYA